MLMQALGGLSETSTAVISFGEQKGVHRTVTDPSSAGNGFEQLDVNAESSPSGLTRVDGPIRATQGANLEKLWLLNEPEKHVI